MTKLLGCWMVDSHLKYAILRYVGIHAIIYCTFWILCIHNYIIYIYTCNNVYLLVDRYIINQTFVQRDFATHFIASKFSYRRVRVRIPTVCGEALSNDDAYMGLQQTSAVRFVFLTALIRILVNWWSGMKSWGYSFVYMYT